ncbi:MAG: T9SS type A sorting domain-containing protein [Ignavibacteriaceae bacterium]|nr:T9SS type A sorting domain-containing protein [Ignavibacteriaceae bacterium]
MYIQEPGQIWFDDQEVGVDWAGYEDWHLYRFTLDIDFVNAYIDEDPTPVFFGITTKPTSDNELRWGDGSTDRKFGSYIDWIIWDTTGAYAPGQGTPLPNDIITGISDVTNIPTHHYLSQNFPNPYNPVTTIKYQIPELSFVTLKVYDVLGNEISTLVNEQKPSGEYEIEFDGAEVPSGIYFYRLKSGSFVETKKMVLMK